MLDGDHAVHLCRLGHTGYGDHCRGGGDRRRPIQRPPFRALPVPFQPASGGGHRGRPGDVDSSALYARPFSVGPGSAEVTIGDVAALDDSSQCSCTWAGVITVTDAGQTSMTLQ